MKKLALSIAIILGMGMTTFAQEGYTHHNGGLFQRGDTPHYDYYADWADLGWTRATGLFNLPGAHGLTDDQNGAPIGSGLALLLGLGGAYLVAKRRKEK